MKEELKAELQTNVENLIYIFFNLWTSPNSLAFITIIIYYCDKAYKNRTRLITFRRLRGNHFGENMAAFFTEIIKKYGFKNRLGYFVTDNIKSNDVCIDYIF